MVSVRLGRGSGLSKGDKGASDGFDAIIITSYFVNEIMKVISCFLILCKETVRKIRMTAGAFIRVIFNCSETHISPKKHFTVIT